MIDNLDTLESIITELGFCETALMEFGAGIFRGDEVSRYLETGEGYYIFRSD